MYKSMNEIYSAKYIFLRKSKQTFFYLCIKEAFILIKIMHLFLVRKSFLSFVCFYWVFSLMQECTAIEHRGGDHRETIKNNWVNILSDRIIFGMAAMPFLCRGVWFSPKLSYHRNESLAVYKRGKVNKREKN